MAKKNRPVSGTMIDCACVIHSTGYNWRYVENLYNMLTRNLPGGIRFHVYTEHDRSVPPHMIKHILTEWPGIAGPKKSWWYKMQMFNPQHHAGNLLYLDLDTVVVRDLSWVLNHDTGYFWGIRDFRYLQNSHFEGFNSSFMWWNVSNFSWIWDQFSKGDIAQLTKNNQGDQDYITKALNVNQRRFFDDKLFQSFRWQCLDGGYNFQRRQHRSPATGVKISPDAAVVVFHGSPKPHQISDPTIAQLWR